MQSFLLITNNPKEQQAYLNTFHTEHKISLFDQTILSEEGSVGIAAVRALQQRLYLAPQQGKEKSIIIQNAQALTTEAQNALLKILEEPPSFVFIFLLATKADVLLPTILSRCQLIVLDREKEQHISPEITQELKIIFDGTPAQKLVLAEKISGDKKKLQEWFEQAMIFYRTQMLERKTEQSLFVPLLNQLQETYQLAQTTNVNLRLLMEHFFLSL